MKNKIILTAIAFVLTANLSFAQKLKSGDWEVSIVKWDKNEKGMFGESATVYEGIVNIKKGKRNMKPHIFEYFEASGKVVVKNTLKKVVAPQMSFDNDIKSFKYNKVTGEEIITKVEKASKAKDVVLSGIIVWLNYVE